MHKVLEEDTIKSKILLQLSAKKRGYVSKVTRRKLFNVLSIS